MIDELFLKFGLQDAHHVTTPVEFDHDTSMREANPILPANGQSDQHR